METQLPNIKALVKACHQQGCEYSFIDDNKNAMAVSIAGKTHYFVKSSTPLNKESEIAIVRDKEFTHRLLKLHIRMPETVGYFTPYPNADSYKKYAVFESVADISRDVVKQFSFPVVVKMNSGSKGRNVSLCRDEGEVVKALQAVFNRKSADWDYVAIVQEYVVTRKEYRVIMLDGEVVLLYQKVPLFFSKDEKRQKRKELSEGAYSVDIDFLQRVQDFLQPVFSVLPMCLAGCDLVEDTNGSLHFIELNSSPQFSGFISRYGDDEIVAMYVKIVELCKKI